MGKTLPLLLSVLLLGTWNGTAQTTAPEDAAPEADIRMISYDDPKPYTIEDVRIYGVRYLDTDLLRNASGLTKGSTIYIPGNAVSQAISRLWSQRYFSDVKVVAEFLPDDKVNLEIYLQERPRVYNWNFEGIRKGEANTLTDDLQLKRGSELSDYILDKNVRLITKHFVDKGFRNVEVSTRIENDTTVRNAVNVTFVIDKNERVRIGAIDFEGNESFTDKRLRRTMKKTHQVNPNIFQSFRFKEEDYEADKENLLDFYNSQGFRNAVIVRDSMYTINDKRIGIDITLEEGDRFYIRNITWVGNTKYDTEYLQSLLGIHKGDVYDKKTIHQRLGIGKEMNPEDYTQIMALYQNDGYLMSTIEPTEVVVGADSIDLEIKVFEGKQFRINEVDISGNMNVDDEVIRRELYTRPGELYNRAMLMQTMRQLATMQFFDAASLAPSIQPVTNELVDIGWPLVESGSDKFEVSLGAGGGMFVGSVAVQLNNLSVKNFFKKHAWRPYPKGQGQQLSIQLQSNASYYTAFSGSFTEPWLGGRKPNSLTISAYYSNQTDSYAFGGVFRKGNAYFRTTGIAAGLGRRLSLPDPYFTLYNELSYTSYNLKDWNMFSLFNNGRANIFAFRTVFARNTVNNPVYPSSGSEFSLELSLTPPYSLFDNKDYKNMSEADPAKHRWIEYHKWQGKFRWYLPLTPDQKLVFMASAEMGYLGHYNKYKQSPFEGFDVGGDGMIGYNIYGVDIISLRGYSNSSLTPYDPANPNAYANVYNKYTLELRYPFVQGGQTQIYGLVFAEAGNGFRSWQEFDPFKVHRSLGVGVRLYLSFLGMIGLDWGYGFDGTAKSAGPHGGKLHFTMGTQF